MKKTTIIFGAHQSGGMWNCLNGKIGFPAAPIRLVGISI